MKILAIEREIPGVNSAQFNRHLKAQAIHLYRLHQAGVLREFYFKNNELRSVMILECPSIDEAERILQELPLTQQKLVRFELITLRQSPGYSRLYVDQMNALT